ncbi:MAG: beta strand repeat-containing protein [Caulobacteraceae bacterium]
MVDPVSASPLALFQGQTALALLTSSSNPNTAISDAILGAYQSSFASSADGSSFGSAVNLTPPTAPWNSADGTPPVATAVRNAVDGQPVIDPGSAKLDAPAGVSTQDYQNLFALYQGLNSLYGLATTAAQAGTSTADPTLAYLKPAQLQAAFASGMSDLENFLSNDPFTGFNLTAGKVQTEAQSSVGIPNGTYQTYTTGVIATGDESQPLSAFQGDVQFNITVASKYAATTITNPDGTKKTVTAPPKTIPIDLSGMGSAPRTIDGVVNYINAQLKAAQVTTRFSAANLGSTASTTTLPNGQTIANKGSTQWGLTVNGSSGEVVSFSGPSTAAAVYVSSATGGARIFQAPGIDPVTGAATSDQTTTAKGEQLMKLQTGQDVSGTQPPTITNAGSTTGLPVGAVFAKALPDGVSSVAASASGSDGSVYLLADAAGAVNNAPVQGGQGVVLLKYDSAGKLLASKVVAGLQSASGASIAIGADGTVAVAGTNTTTATTSAAGLTTEGTTQAFVQVYDATGAPTWSKTVPALAGTSTATGVAIGSDGAVYLGGQTTGSVGNQTPQGDQDEFIQGFDKTGSATFTKQFGSRGINTSAGLAYDTATDTLYTAGLEDSQAVVRSFALTTTTTGAGASARTTTTAAQSATRNLGFATSLAGIGLTNGQVVVGGTAGAATVRAGTVARAYAGVSDGFIASVDSSLTPASGDTVAYLGQPGATQVATALTVAGGQAYLAGTLAGDPSSLAKPDATEGFVTGVDAATGAVSYSSKFPGANGQDAPSAITVATAGSSILDQLGLPQGTINGAASNLITAATSIQAGQSFWARTSPGGPQTQVKITATDTLKTLTDKLNIALAGQGQAQVLNLGSNSQLEITPNSPSSFIELDSQQASDDNPAATASSLKTDVLAALGLPSGVIRQVHEINNLTDVTQLREYGLDLPTNLDLSTAASAQHAANALQAAMSAVMSAYQDLASPPTMASEALAAAQNTGGAVPAYLSSEIANLQAGLSRLTGGSGGG